MKSSIRMQNKRRQLGQGMTEYIIIVALVAVAGIGTYRFFGQTIRNQMAGLAQEVGGAPANNARAAAATSANNAATQAVVNKNMGNYDTNNR
jgi:Flp pilus assembly pilin Flp